MKLFFDENLSPKLTKMLAGDYPDSIHARDADLRGVDDRLIWDYCRARGLAIVSKDTDFRERSFVEGFPPKVIWLDVGNAGTTAIAGLMQRERQRVEAFERQEETSFIILSLNSRAI